MEKEYIVKLTPKAAPLVKGGNVGFDEAKDFNWLFAPHCDWILSTARSIRGTEDDRIRIN